MQYRSCNVLFVSMHTATKEYNGMSLISCTNEPHTVHKVDSVKNVLLKSELIKQLEMHSVGSGVSIKAHGTKYCTIPGLCGLLYYIAVSS